MFVKKIRKNIFGNICNKTNAEIVHALCIYRVNKNNGISGILADFGRRKKIQPVMATNIIENFTIFEIF